MLQAVTPFLQDRVIELLAHNMLKSKVQLMECLQALLDKDAASMSGYIAQALPIILEQLLDKQDFNARMSAL